MTTLSLLVVGTTNAASAVATPAGAPTGCGPAWTVVGGGAFWYGAAVISPSDIWVVGVGANGQPATELWNGSAWTSMTTPPAAGGQLTSVSALSPDDVWAVGSTNGAPLAEHWDGTSWSVTPTPDPGTLLAYFTSVNALSADNVWAVGFWASGSNPSPSGELIEHWDGTAWSVVRGPIPGATLVGLSALGPNDSYAVGGPNLEHWDGTSWSAVGTPPPPPTGAYLLDDVVAYSDTDIWMVGEYAYSGYAYPRLFHWDGSGWSIIDVDAPINAVLSGMWSTGLDSFVAVGDQGISYASSPQPLIVEVNDGKPQVISNAPDVPYGDLNAVAGSSDGSIFIAAGIVAEFPGSGVVEDYCPAPVAPAITSGVSATFTTGAMGSFTAKATGVPAPTLTESGPLPTGLTFIDNDNGTATLSGTPAAGTGGAYPITITASNGISPNAIQDFTLTVDEPPSFTAANPPLTATARTIYSYPFTASGFPAPTFSLDTGAPSWLSINSATGTVSGTVPTHPQTFTYSVTATNTVGSITAGPFTVAVRHGKGHHFGEDR